MRLERWRRNKEVDAWEIPLERLQDGEYWKRRYEDAVNDIEKALEPLGGEVFPKGLLHKDYDEREDNARGKTT